MCGFLLGMGEIQGTSHLTVLIRHVNSNSKNIAGSSVRSSHSLLLTSTESAFSTQVDYFPVSRNTLESAEWSWSLLGSHELAGMNEFQRLLLQNAAFTPPRDIVSGIPENTRTLRIPNVPHSIAEELWHIVFWQDHFLRCTRREDFLYPKHASLGWRTIDSFRVHRNGRNWLRGLSSV